MLRHNEDTTSGEEESKNAYAQAHKTIDIKNTNHIFKCAFDATLITHKIDFGDFFFFLSALLCSVPHILQNVCPASISNPQR